MKDGWQVVIGLEVHAQLASRAKIFCPDPVAYGEAPNTLVSPISLAHPGTLPTLNEACVHKAVQMGLATHCHIHETTWFARKNYFYPDLPKGYQISQFDTPICTGGHLDIRLPDGREKRIGITRIHLEEDAGKNLHDQDLVYSLVDYNRVGTGLIEIVSEPDLRSAEEAAAYLTEIRKLVRYLGICDGNMEEGSLRADANVSVMRITDTQFGVRAEIKNINSISNMAKAIVFEAHRQIALYEAGERMVQQTRSWDAGQQRTVLMREKETADDYRYFTEPDLLPIVVDAPLQQQLRAQLPALPRERYMRYTTQLGLPDFDASMLTEQRAFSDFFEALLALGAEPKMASNWLNGPVKTWMNEQARDFDDFPLSPQQLNGLLQLVRAGSISFSVAKDSLFPLLLAQPSLPAQQLAEQHNLLLDTKPDDIRQEADRLLDAHPEQLASLLGGKEGLLGFFVGKLMQGFKGKADPKLINQILKDAIDSRR